MDNDQLVLGLAAVFFGMTAVSLVAALAVNPLLAVFAMLFGPVGYMMWYQASGRMAERLRSGRARRGRRAERTASDGPRGPGFGDATGRRRRAGADARGRRAGDGEWAGRGPRAGFEDGPTPEEAYRTLGVSPDASADEVTAAYREKAKELHPDSDGGDAEAFKELNRAYERVGE